jgi:hypothetical protein
MEAIVSLVLAFYLNKTVGSVPLFINQHEVSLLYKGLYDFSSLAG